jgi:polyisoprenoid-binding protein YceI
VSNSIKGVIAAVVVIVILGGVGVWYFAIRDTSQPTASLDAIAPGGTAGPNSNRTSPAGAWKVQTAGDSVFVGYRVGEVLSGLQKTANGRSTAVTGTMTVAGNQVTAVTVTADTTKLTSDQPRRDGSISARGLETSKFPQATFTLTKPIELANVTQGSEVAVTATGDLTLHGVTKSVEVPLKAKWSGDQITVATVGDGLPIAFADYGIEPFDIAGLVKTEDHGTLEMQLLFVPA